MPPKRRRRYHGVYYHSSPPRILQMNGNTTGSGGQDDRTKEAFVVRPSNIRIWIHDENVGKLTKVLWAGQGNRLRAQASNNPRVRKFLDAVPHVLNVIKDAHQAVIENDLEILQLLMAPRSVPRSLITSKDQNGLTVVHKAAGLAHTMILEYLLEIWPDGATAIDGTGKSPLHWAASAKNNTRCYNLLVQAGAYEELLDYKMKPAAYYRTRPGEIDKSLLTVIPDAPRIPRDSHPDWSALVDDDAIEFPRVDHISNRFERQDSETYQNGKNLLTTRSGGSSFGNNSDPDMDDGEVKMSIEVGEDLRSAVEEEKLIEEKLTDNAKAKIDDVINGNEIFSRGGSPLLKLDNDPQNENQSTEMENEIIIKDGPDASEEPEEPEPKLEELDLEEFETEENKTNDDDLSTKAAEGGVDQQNEYVNEIYNKGETELDEDKENENDKAIEELEPDTKCGSNAEENTNQFETNIEETDEKIEDSGSDDVEVIELTEDSNVSENTNGNGDFQEGTESDNENKEIQNEDNENIYNGIDENIPDEENRKDENVEKIQNETDDNIQVAVDGQYGEIQIKITEDIQNENDENDNLLSINNEDIQNGRIENDEKENNKNEVNQNKVRNNSPETHEDYNKNQIKLLENEASKQNGIGEEEDADEEDDDQIENSMSIPNGHIEKLIEAFDGNLNEGSPSPALQIEGVVQGEADDNQVQSEGGIFLDDESRIKSVISSGDMEQLAALVLNGEGKKLLGARSPQPEIQAFLGNVRAYMSKIRRVHQAARNGNLRELQAALDRRKFAIAKDAISPNGASPLHVATIFGHAGIVRYLGGRFPETTSAIDDNGRTPLHYAATINDNGHFYNLLTHLGSNPKATDRLGNTAEFYRNQEHSKDVVFSYRKLLRDFGADDKLEEKMLSDQVPDDLHSARRYLDDPDILSTLERCYRLIHEPYKQSDLAAGFLTPGSASSVRLPVTSYLAKFLKRSIFDKIKYRQTRLDHNLFDIIWPAMKKSSRETLMDEDLNGGVIAPDFDVFVVFQEFLVPLIKDMHCMNLSQDFKPHPRMFYFPLVAGEPNNNINLNIEKSGRYVLHSFIECSRNLDDFELPVNLNIAQLEQAERLMIEKILSTDFARATDDSEAGIYYTMNEVLENSSDIRAELAASKLLIPLLDNTDSQMEAESLALNGQYWPYGRGVFINDTGDLAVWINVQEHLRIIVSNPSDKPADIGYAYSKIGRALMFLDGNLHFRESYLLGCLTSRPSFLGTALKMSTIVVLPHLVKELENLRHLCLVRGLNILPNRIEHNVRLVNMQSLGISEWRLFQDYCSAVTNILQLEKDMALTNTKQIAATLVKIFRRKKNTIIEE